MSTSDDLLLASALRGEAWLSVLRVVFCIATWSRFVYFGGFMKDGAVTPSGWVSTPAKLLAFAFSAWILVRIARGTARRRDLYASVLVDAVVCFTSLVHNALWPRLDYQGLILMPDIAALYLVATAAMFRLLVRVVVVAGAANFVSLIVLAAVDVAHGVPFDADRFTFVALMLVAAVAVAVAVGNRTASLASASEAAARRAAAARATMQLLLEEHHDVRSVLSSALLNAQVAHKELSSSSQDAKAGVAIERLGTDLADVIERMRRTSRAGVADVVGVRAANMKNAAERAVAIARGRFVDVRFVVDADPSLQAVVAGGAETLERILVTLLTNAAEGDGDRRASNVRIAASASGGRFDVVVEDDGPGFREELLGASVAALRSTKPNGAGVGLLLCDGLVAFSGGTLRRENAAAGGARVTITLPVPASSPSSSSPSSSPSPSSSSSSS